MNERTSRASTPSKPIQKAAQDKHKRTTLHSIMGWSFAQQQILDMKHIIVERRRIDLIVSACNDIDDIALAVFAILVHVYT